MPSTKHAFRPTSGSLLFSLFVFMLMSAPKLNIRIGSVPLYFIDFLIVFLLSRGFGSLGRGPNKKYEFSFSVISLMIIAALSELVGLNEFGNIKESAYILVRTTLAMSVFFLAIVFVKNPKDFDFVMRAIMLGLIVNSSIMILSSLPMTRQIASDIFFSTSFLDPAGAIAESAFENEKGIRGRTLVGVSILGATFINVCWPFAAMLLRWPWKVSRLWKILALFACLLAPIGVLMSYSRGPIIGSVGICFFALIFGLRYVRSGIIFPVILGAAVVASVGVTSQIFFFDRLTTRTDAIFTDPFADERESERLLAYIEPFEHVVEHPRFFILGEGVAIRYSSGSLALPEQYGKATHAIFAMGYYSYGMVGALLYISLLIRALFRALAVSKRYGTVTGLLGQSLFLSTFGLVPWFIFGHAAISTPRGAMMFFLVLGLISALGNFRTPFGGHVFHQRRDTIANSRHLAFR